MSTYNVIPVALSGTPYAVVPAPRPLPSFVSTIHSGDITASSHVGIHPRLSLISSYNLFSRKNGSAVSYFHLQAYLGVRTHARFHLDPHGLRLAPSGLLNRRSSENGFRIPAPSAHMMCRAWRTLSRPVRGAFPPYNHNLR